MNAQLRTCRRLLIGAALFGATGAALAAALPIPPAPTTDAASYVLMDARTGQILAEKDPGAHRAPASTTKLMTAYVTFQALAAGRVKLTTPCLVSQSAWRQIGSRMFIKPGTRVSVDDLLQGLLIPSGNDAAVALAQCVAGTSAGFVNIMNADAKALGLTNTHYMNPTGLPDPGHYTSAHDLAVLARALIIRYPKYYHYFSQRSFTWNGITQSNWNKLLWLDPTVDGLKTGYTANAGYCLVASAKRGDQRMIAVVMGVPMVSKNHLMANYRHLARVDDALLNYGFRFFKTREIYPGGKVLARVRVWKGEHRYVAATTAGPFYATVPVGAGSALSVTSQAEKRVAAPVRKGARLGTITVSYNGKVIATAPLVAAKAVPEGGLWPRLRDTVLGWL